MNRLRLLVLVIALPLFIAACGGERTFDARDFVERANELGAGLELGESLHSEREEVRVYSLELLPVAASGEVQEDSDEHRGGSLIVSPDAEGARAEFARCERAASLACYRAANVVLALEGEPGDPQLVGVDGAIRAMASE